MLILVVIGMKWWLLKNVRYFGSFMFLKWLYRVLVIRLLMMLESMFMLMFGLIILSIEIIIR